MGIVTSVSNQKGGPGKTTITRNLSEELADKGRLVLVIDNDPQGNLTKSFTGESIPNEILSVRMDAQKKITEPGESNTALLYKEGLMPEPFQITDNMYLIGATRHLADMADSGTNALKLYKEFQLKLKLLAEAFDDIIIDCPPAAGNLQTAAHIGSDFLLIPTHLSEDSVDGVGQQIESSALCKETLNPKLKLLGIVVNEKKSHKINVEKLYLDTLKTDYPDSLFKTIINESVKVSEARSLGLSVKKHASSSLQADQFQNLTAEYLERVVEMSK